MYAICEPKLYNAMDEVTPLSSLEIPGNGIVEVSERLAALKLMRQWLALLRTQYLLLVASKAA